MADEQKGKKRRRDRGVRPSTPALLFSVILMHGRQIGRAILANTILNPAAAQRLSCGGQKCCVIEQINQDDHVSIQRLLAN